MKWLVEGCLVLGLREQEGCGSRIGYDSQVAVCHRDSSVLFLVRGSFVECLFLSLTIWFYIDV